MYSPNHSKQVQQEQAESVLHPFKKNKQNVILIRQRPSIGQVRPCPYSLLPQEKCYGKATVFNKDGGVKEITKEWLYHSQSLQNQPPRDFMALNKKSIQSGIVTSKNQREWRKGHDARVQVKEGQRHFEVYLPEEDFLYGKKVRPSTPVKELLSYRYGNEGKEEKLHIYNDINEFKRQKKAGASLMGAGKAIVQSQSVDKFKLERLKQQEKHQKIDNFKIRRYVQIPSKIGNQGLKSESFLRTEQDEAALPQLTQPE